MDPELIKTILVDGGSLAVFVVLVIYLTIQQGKERAAMHEAQALERKATIEALMATQDSERARAAGNMQIGVAGLDKVNGSLKELTQANIELSKAMAVHDTAMRAGVDSNLEATDKVVAKLDRLAEALASKP